MLSLSGIAKARGNFRLGPMDLDVPGGITAIVGPNGAGKTTLFDILTRLLSPDSGAIEYPSDTPLRVGYLPQGVKFPPRARTLAYLEYVAWLWQLPSDTARVALEAVGLADRARDRISSLSGGMQQRVGIAQAIIGDPTLIILDEPTTGLDPARRIQVRETIRQVAHTAPCLISTHLVEDVRALADRVVVLVDGQVKFSGSVPQLEQREAPGAPGDSPLERALSSLIGVLE